MPIKRSIKNKNIEKENVYASSHSQLLIFLEQEINAPFLTLTPELNENNTYRFIVAGVNQTFLEHSALSKDKLLNENFFDLFPLNEEWHSHFNNALTSAQKVYFTDYFPPFSKQAKICCYKLDGLLLLIFKQVSKPKANKPKPRFEWLDTVFETVFNTIKEAIIITDSQKNILICNTSVYKIFGYKTNELVGKSISTLYSTEQDYLKTVKNQNTSPNKKTVDNIQALKYKDKSGRVFTGELSEIDLYDNDNQWIGIFSIIRDITERENLIQELVNSKNRAVESDRLKTAFLDNMSHEIRTPLNGILGFSKLLTNENLNQERRNFYVDTIQKSGKQLLNIVTDIIDISKIETNQIEIIKEKFSVDEFLKDVHKEFMPLAKQKNLNLIYENTPDNKQLEIFCDKEKLRRVLFNLLTNAIKFTPKGNVSFGYTVFENNLELFVQDTGIGLSEKFKEKIFDRFIQADMTETRSYGGNGLGLAICKGFVEAMGGKIWAESKKDKGSRFLFTVPKKELKQKQTAMSTNEPIKILVAEDEHLNYLLLEEILVQEGFNIIYAQDGKEAVELYQTNTDIKVIIMDIRMPNMDGYEAIKQIRKINPKMPVIALTAFAMTGDRERVLNAGFNEYVSKPFTVNHLLSLINKYL